MSIASTLPNTAKITDQMAGMPDAALQQMAQMYKQDPYVLPLIVSESQRRQMLRAKAQAQNSMQMGQPPKVVDAAIAAMSPAAQPAPPMPGRPMPSMAQMEQQLPENQGIATLPSVQDTEYAAEGGIMGYANEGFVDLKTIPDAARAELERAQLKGDREAMLNTIKKLAAAGYDVATLIPRGVMGAFESGVTRPLRALGVPIPYLPESAYGGDRSSMTPMMDKLARAEQTQAPAPAVSDAYPDELSSGRTAYQDTGAAARSFEDVVDTAQKQPTAQTSTGIAQLVSPAVAPAPDVRKIVREAYAPIEGNTAEIEGRLFVLGQEAEADAYRRHEELKEQQKSGAELYKKRGERLGARDKEVAKSEHENKWLSVILGGLEMAATPGTLGQSASAGAKVGSANYIKGQEKLNAAKDKLLDARDRHEELMLNRDDMNLKELRASNKEIADAKRRSQELAIEGLKLRLNVSTEEAKAIIKGSTELALQQQQLQTQANISTSTQATQRAIAAMPGKDERLYEALSDPNSKVAVGLARYAAAMGKDKDTATRDFVDFVTAATKNADPTNPPNMDTLLQQFIAARQRLGNTGIVSTLPRGSQVVK